MPSLPSVTNSTLALAALNGHNVDGMRLQVQCYSGRKADERPIRFRLGESDYMVEEIVDQWYGPHDQFFKVRADDGNLYILRQNKDNAEGEWTLESFRMLKTHSAGL
jgi:hypothetical protein